MLRPRYALRITVSALVSALAIALALAAVSPSGAQGADVQIAQLSCSGDPELVVIENFGDAVQTLTSWELQSDPPESQTFDLSVLGGLAPGASVAIQSGPAASGVFKWGLEFIYRDDDPKDYARIVDDTGAIVHQLNCAEATPTPTPSPSPTPSPEPTPAAEVPNGGGAPPLPSGSPSPAMTLLVGGSLVVAGIALFALPRFRLRPALAVAASSPPGDYRGESGNRRGRSSTALSLTLVGVCAVAMFLILRRRA